MPIGSNMAYISVIQFAEKYGISERTARNYYHRTQIDLTYNSNHIEGSKLTHDQTRYIFETNTIGITDQAIRVDDILETVNHSVASTTSSIMLRKSSQRASSNSCI